MSGTFGSSGAVMFEVGENTQSFDASHNQWLITPSSNVNGVLVNTLIVDPGNSGDAVYVGSDEGTVTNNRKLMGRTEGTVYLQNLYLPPGEGLHSNSAHCWISYTNL